MSITATPSNTTRGAHIVTYYSDAERTKVVDIRECSCRSSDHRRALEENARGALNPETGDERDTSIDRTRLAGHNFTGRGAFDPEANYAMASDLEIIEPPYSD